MAAAAKAASQEQMSQQIAAAAVAASQPTASILPQNSLQQDLSNVASTAPQLNQIAQAAQAVQALQHQVQMEQIQQHAVNQIVAQHQQAAAAHQAAQQIVAHQQQQHQQAQLAAAVAAAATVIGVTPSNVVSAQTAADMVQNQAAVAALQARVQPTPLAQVLPTPSNVMSIPPPAPVSALNNSPPSEPTPATSSNEMVAVPKNLLMKLVQKNIENNQQAHCNPPLKCCCRCQCGRYPTSQLIVDKVMADLLSETSQANDVIPQEPMMLEEDKDCCLLDERDHEVLTDVIQANAFWNSEPAMEASSATDVALRRLIRMISHLKTFRALSRADQTNLLKHGCASHFAIRSAMTMNDNSWQQNQLLSETVVQFFNALNEEWRSNESIMLLLSVLAIFDPTTVGVQNVELVAMEANKLKRVLKR